MAVNKCHQYLHEPNPYKKDWKTRESECENLLEESKIMLLKIWKLLKCHYRVSELNDGEKVGLICQLGADEKAPVFVANLLSDGKENSYPDRDTPPQTTTRPGP